LSERLAEAEARERRALEQLEVEKRRAFEAGMHAQNAMQDDWCFDPPDNEAVEHAHDAYRAYQQSHAVSGDPQ
jgi:hypothetical protein